MRLMMVLVAGVNHRGYFTAIALQTRREKLWKTYSEVGTVTVGFSIRKTNECDAGGACPLSEANTTRRGV